MEISNLWCRRCKRKFKVTKEIFRCGGCGEVLDIVYDYGKIRKSLQKNFKSQPASHWKYRSFYPIERPLVTLGEGSTPLILSEKISKAIGAKIFLKFEGTNPTCSFKDRGSTVEISYAKSIGVKRVACASTGNMGASIAAYSSACEIDSVVFLPKLVAKGKVQQIRCYGAKIEFVRGTYEKAREYVENFCREGGAYLTGDYPYRCEGEKSAGFEIADQLRFEPPDFIAAPVGNGTLIYAIWKSFKEMEKVGLIKKFPRLIAVQAKGCSPIVNAFNRGLEEFLPIKRAKTIASAIACENPIYGNYALSALRESDGLAIAVSDREILKARKLLGKAGIFAEPAASASIAGIFRLNKVIRGSRAVCLVTGHGLKGL